MGITNLWGGPVSVSMWEKLRFLQHDITGLSESSSRNLVGKKANMKCVYLHTPLGYHNYFFLE